MNYLEDKNLTSVYFKMINENVNQNKKARALQAALDREKKMDYWITLFGRAYENNNENDLNESLVNVLRLLGVSDQDIPFVIIYEIFLNSEDVGKEIENSIQGFDDPNDIFSPEEILQFKIKIIQDDLMNNNLQNAYYFHQDDPEMMLKPDIVAKP